jgi:papain like protease/pYEATS domain-containing protein involved in immunity
MRTVLASITVLLIGAACGSVVAHAQDAPTKGKGLILMEEEAYDALPERDPLMRGRLPGFVDLSSFFPTPGHQGTQGSCVGWAVGYALKTYQEALEFDIARPQEWDHFSPSFVFNSIKQGEDCRAGSRISDALSFVTHTGAVRMNDFPYEDAICLPPSEDIKAGAQEFSIESYRRLQRDGLLFAVREALSNEKPVVIAMRVFPSFETWQGDGNYRHDPENEFQVDFHAVTVVGYDDARQALKIINSWGTDWGDDGFFWLDYAAARPLIAEAYVTTDRRYDEPVSEDPEIVMAGTAEETGTNVAASAPDEREDTAPVTALTKATLMAAITGHVGRDSDGQTPRGYEYFPASVWLNLEPPELAQIASVEYYFYHPTYSNPMRPVSDSNVFLATWKGYGCIEDAEAKVTLTSGETISAPFNLCTIWDRFHPGAFRKDGTSEQTEPLADVAAFGEDL